MKINLVTTIPLFLVASTAAYSPKNAPSGRRELLKSAVATGIATAFVSSPANAINACPAGSKNCIRTMWNPPSGSKMEESISSLRKVLEAYPQEGQQKVDLGGWTLVEDNFGSGSARIEYKSGIGEFVNMKCLQFLCFQISSYVTLGNCERSIIACKTYPQISMRGF
jgi:hypothetical protein